MTTGTDDGAQHARPCWARRTGRAAARAGALVLIAAALALLSAADRLAGPR